MTSRWPAALLAIIAFFSSWNLWAIVTDNQLTMGQDCFLYPALHVASEIREGNGDLSRLFLWGAKGPVGTLLGLLFSYLVGVAPVGGRLVSVLAHAALVALSFSLGRRLTGRAVAGLWAAFICGATPMLFGWARLEYPEMVLAVVVLAAIRMVLRRDLERPWPAMWLGVLFGLGIMTKVGFVAFMVVPGLWLLARHLRGPRPAALKSLALTLGAMALLVAPWIVFNFGPIYENLRGSTTTADLSVLEKVVDYLELTGMKPLLAMTAAALVVLWLSPRVRRPDLILLGLFTGLSLLLFMLVFDSWSRYIVPILAVAAVLTGCGVHQLGQKLPRPARLAAGALFGVGALAWFIWLNTTPVQDLGTRRELTAGMLSPDRRQYMAYPRAVAELRARTGADAMILFDSPETSGRVEGLDMIQRIWGFNGYVLRNTSLRETKARLASGHPAGIMVVSGSGTPPLGPETVRQWAEIQGDGLHIPRDFLERQRDSVRWFIKQKRVLLGSHVEYGDITIEAYTVPPRR